MYESIFCCLQQQELFKQPDRFMEFNDNQFDFTRNDKFYSLTVPRFSQYDDTILYQFHLKDLVTNREYVYFFRFKELKQIHQSMSVLKLELPQFPKTHFWRKTNKNPEMIEQRRLKLQYYFQIILNDPFTRGYSEIKKLIKKMKYSSRKSHRFSSPPPKSGLTTTCRTHSLSRVSNKKIQIQDLKKQTSPKQSKSKVLIGVDN